MARKPNYRFDRMERDRAKAAKKAERLKARQERSVTRGEDGEAPDDEPDDTPADDDSVADAQPGANED